MPSRKITFIGVPLDLGAGRRGVDMGPSAFRLADIHQKVRELGYEVDDAGDMEVSIQETREPGDPRMKFLKEIRSTCAALRDKVIEVLSRRDSGVDQPPRALERFLGGGERRLCRTCRAAEGRLIELDQLGAAAHMLSHRDQDADDARGEWSGQRRDVSRPAGDHAHRADGLGEWLHAHDRGANADHGLDGCVVAGLRTCRHG